MKIKSLVALIAVFSSMVSANAQVSAEVVCDGGKTTPILKISYGTGKDARTPGLFWIGILSEDQTKGSFLTTRGWEDYQGGLYPYQARFDGGLAPVINLSTALPGSYTSTVAWVGYRVYVGHGVYSQENRQRVANRRAVLDASKERLVAKGGWRPEYETDEYYIWTLVQRDMMNNKKYGPIFTIPFIDCDIQGGG
ncbi:hypothetical protein [Acidovorax carolinensis]|uniref:hypothetical protein n=1 Tax=Acidovorax carolinensis TaxID=553814 RepID=UPI0012FF9F6A|nr:hypothetical protein [Acidovorax carolinensis]